MILEKWLAIHPQGLYFTPGEFYIDPIEPVAKAIITHGHGDHARAGHGMVIATPLTVKIMQTIYGEDCADFFKPLAYEESLSVNKAKIYFLPAGHILGSAQLVIEYNNFRFIISGDYKRAFDPTCEPFKVESCDVFITEATFALPVFKHPLIQEELIKLLYSLQFYSDRCHLLAAYPLGKTQRLIRTLRLMGYQDPIYIHGALRKLCALYQNYGINLGDLRSASDLNFADSGGKIVFCPPHALQSRWNRRFSNVLLAMASGWMQVRARAKQKHIELPLVISDHADWCELTGTLREIAPQEIAVTHGREEALVYYAKQQGFCANSLHLLGYEETGH